MQCDVCGREIIGKPHRVVIEGANVTTCAECAKLGSGYWVPREENPAKKAVPRLSKSTKSVVSGKYSLARTQLQDDYEIVEGFGSIIKRAREKLGLTPEDLGKIIGEKESVIKKIEGERIVPDIRLATKLERALKIKLLVKQPETDLNKSTSMTVRGKREVTFGEVVHIKGDGEEG